MEKPRFEPVAAERETPTAQMLARIVAVERPYEGAKILPQISGLARLLLALCLLLWAAAPLVWVIWPSKRPPPSSSFFDEPGSGSPFGNWGRR